MFSLILAAQLALSEMAEASALLHRGLTLYEAGNYREAEPVFRALKEAQVPFPEIAETGLHVHGLVLAEVDRVPEARMNFERLVLTSLDEGRQQRALEAYLEYGGKISDLLPGKSLEEAGRQWLKESLAEPPPREWIDRMGGDLLATVRLLGAEATRDVLELASAPLQLVEATVPRGALRGVVVLRSTRQSLVLEARVLRGQWIFTKVSRTPVPLDETHDLEAEQRRIALHGATRNLSVLRMLGARFSLYTLEHDQHAPATLEALAGGYENMSLWEHPDTHRFEAWLYRHGESMELNPDVVLMAAPRPVCGAREILRVNGRVELMEEEAFIGLAREQGWDLPDTIRSADVKPEDAAAIQVLIQQLAQGSRAERKAAKIALKAYGTTAAPYLRPLLESEDPELRFTAEELYQP